MQSQRQWVENETGWFEMTHDESLIELNGITVRKAKDLLLDGISLSLSRNEFVGIIGPNGAGKTTLLNVLAGF